MSIFSKIAKFATKAFGGDLFTGLSNIAAGVMGYQSSSNTNKSNLQAVRETNQANLDIARENNASMLEQQQRKMAFDTEMWNKQNEYNSPLAQKQRLEEAGYNPYMQSMSSGVATSSPTMDTFTPQAATMQAYQQDPNSYTPSFMQLANSGLSFLQASNLSEQNKALQLANESQRVANKYQEVLLLKKLKSLGLSNDNQELQNFALKLMNDFNKDTYSNRVEMLQKDLMQRSLSNSLLKKQLDFLPSQQQMEVTRFTVDMETIAIQQNLSKQQIRNLVKESDKLDAITKGLGLDNRQKERVMDFVVNQTYFESRAARYKAAGEKWNAVHSYNNRGADNPYKNLGKEKGFVPSLYRGIADVTSLFPAIVR